MYQLKPIIHHQIDNFLKTNKKFLFEVIEKYDSPLNIVFPEVIEFNLNKLKSVFDKEKVNYQIFFAHKTTRTLAFVKKVKELGIGIDVSSVGELDNALKVDFSKSKIIANGPKTPAFLKKLADLEILIIIDSINEFNWLLNYAKKNKKTINILLRFSSEFDYYQKNFHKKIDKFGLLESEIDQIINKCLTYKDFINLVGFSFHLNFDNYQKKVNMIKTILKKIIFLQKEKGIFIKVIDIGGGWKTNFIESKDDWENFLLEFKKYVLGENENLSFSGSKYGYYIENNRLKGDYTFQSFYTEDTGEKILEKILNERFEEIENLPFKKIFQDLDIEIWIEPGKYLIDQTGISLFRVIDIKKRDNENIIFVEGNFTNLWSDRYELFTDPLLIKKNKNNKNNFFGYFISGDLCLDIDMISNHKIFLPEVEINDVLIFLNTASYRMDFVNSRPISHPLPKKIVINNFKIDDYKLEES